MENKEFYNVLNKDGNDLRKFIGQKLLGGERVRLKIPFDPFSGEINLGRVSLWPLFVYENRQVMFFTTVSLVNSLGAYKVLRSYGAEDLFVEFFTAPEKRWRDVLVNVGGDFSRVLETIAWERMPEEARRAGPLTDTEGNILTPIGRFPWGKT